MTIRSQFFDSVQGDRIYTSNDFSAHLHGIYSDGIIQDNDTDAMKVLQSVVPAKSLRVSIGQCFIQGRFVEIFNTAETLIVPSNISGVTRFDSVKVRVNFTTRIGELFYDVGTPSQPQPVRNDQVFELILARVTCVNNFTTITQANILDQRNDIFFCGKSKPTTVRQNFQNLPGVGWKRIAVSNGFFQTLEPQASNIAFANFVIRSINGTTSRHDQMNITASSLIGNPVLEVSGRSRNNSGRNFDGVRIVYDPTFADTRVALEVFVAHADTICIFEIYDNYTANGWFPLNWTAGVLPGGFAELKLDFSAIDMVYGFATTQDPVNAYGVTRTGDIVTKGGLIGTDSGNVIRDLIKINTTDDVEIGNAAKFNKILNDLIISINDKGLSGTEIDGLTIRNLIKLNAINNTEIGSIQRNTLISSLGLGPAFFDGANTFQLHHDGYVTPQVRAFHNASQNVANGAFQIMAFNSERWDTHGMHDNVTNNDRLTATVKGLYMISFSAEIAVSATGQRQVILSANGIPIAVQRVSAASAGTTQLTVSTMYQLNIGDFVTATVFQNSGVTLAVTNNPQFSPEFSMAFVSAY